MAEKLSLFIPDEYSFKMEEITDPAERIRVMKWGILETVFELFENHERDRFHEVESEKLVYEIIGDIAKAKAQKQNSVQLKTDFWLSTETCLDDDVYRLNWEPVPVTRYNYDELFRERTDSKYYHAFASDETILNLRQVGIWGKAIGKLFKKKRGIKLIIDRKYEGGHGGGYKAIIRASW